MTDKTDSTLYNEDILRYYVDIFNHNDEEIKKNDIDNAHVYQWMKEEVPLFQCPDKDIEKTYYFRFWTYRKHIKTTKDGIVITEFLPHVLWSGTHNTINAAVGHHIYEGRWLKNSGKYLKNYIDFLLCKASKRFRYSCWIIDGAYNYSKITDDYDFGEDFIKKLHKYYCKWEKTHRSPKGFFWSMDNYDAMEYSVSGTDEKLINHPGIRPTLNSYMCANAYALSKFADAYGDSNTADIYFEKYKFLKEYINENLFEDGFFRAYHSKGAKKDSYYQKSGSPRELIGYIPFMFNIPYDGREKCFDLLLDKNAFYSEYGLTTVEQSNERFLYSVNHECLWNGYIWPFATSQTLTALKNVAQRTKDKKYKDMFYTLLNQYARMHTRVTEDGRTICWIDEVMDPRNGIWSSREYLKERKWLIGFAGYERGKDYNHSTFCDLVISGLLGIDVIDGEMKVNPLIPDTWDYFRLTGVKVLGKEYDIIYDKTGEKFDLGKGLIIKEIIP